MPSVTNKEGLLPSATEARDLVCSPTNSLFSSNLLSLQVKELLEEVTLPANSSRTRAVEKALFELKSFLETKVPEWPSIPFTDAIERLGDSIQIPLPADLLALNQKEEIRYALGAGAPAQVSVVGSFLLGSTLTTSASGIDGTAVDLALEMPSSLFETKDYLNYRYTTKRAYYLAALAKALTEIAQRKASFFAGWSVSYEAIEGDVRRPILVLSNLSVRSVVNDNGEEDGKKGSTKAITLRLFPTPPSSLFTPRKLGPSRNCLRKTGATTQLTQPPPTPQYNTGLLVDASLVKHLSYLHRLGQTCRSFKDAVLLGKVWLAQRKAPASSQEGHFSGFLFSMVLGHLLSSVPGKTNKRLSTEFSAYQLFKGTLDFLATHDFAANPVFLTPDGKPLQGDEDFSAEAFTKRFDAVIVDPSGQVNLAARVTAANLMEIQYEARLSLSLLKDHFDAVFLTKVHPSHLRFDHYVRIPMDQLSLPAYSPAATVDFPSQRIFALHYIPKVLKKGLNKRVKLLAMSSKALGAWPVTATPPQDADAELFIGLILDPEHAFADVEQGPALDETAALDSFRRIWGEKSEMRRFKDGSLAESVVFEADGTFEDRARVTQKMAAFLLKRHMGATVEEGVQYYSGPFYSLLRAPGIDLSFKSFQGVNDAFAELGKQLKGLSDLPLSITSVIPSHSGLYFSSVFVPQPVPDEHAFSTGYRPYTEPIDVVIEFETSGHWPDNLAKLQQMKRAFYLKIAKSINEACPGTTAQVNIGLERNVMESGWVDITTISGFKFRCRIHSEREKYLLDQKTADDAHDTKKRYQNDFVNRPCHALKMYNLCMTHHFLPFTIRLVKRWAASHMLSLHIPDQAIETLCAYVFSNSAPWSAPGSSWVGFTRVLHLLSTFNWTTEPLIVEMETGKLTEELRVKINANYKASAKQSWFIATEDNMNGTAWPSPDSVILNRMRMLAKTCINLIENEMMGATSKWIMKLFTTPLNGYDAIIRLSPQKCSRFRENIWFDSSCLPQTVPKYRNLISVKDRESALISKIDTVSCYMAEVSASFRDVAWFFVDPYGGDAVAVVWKHRDADFKWKVDAKLNFFHQEVKSDSKKKSQKAEVRVTMNSRAMLSEMERMGAGLVTTIDIFAK